MLVGDNTVKLLRLFLSNRFLSLGKIRIGEKDLEEIRKVRKFFSQYVLG
jgi:hypothetical protein